MNRTAWMVAAAAGLGFGTSAVGQDDPTVASAAALVERLRAAGVELPEGIVVNGDGTVTLPLPSGDEPVAQGEIQDAAAEVAEQAEEAATDEASDGGDAVDAADLDAPEWDTKLNMGVNVASGNTEQIGFATTIQSTRETKASVLALDAGYFYSSQDGDKTANRFTSGVNHDWLLPDSRWLYFLGGRYDWDEFKSFDHRISVNGGVGYELIKRDDLSLTLRAGGGGFKEIGSGRNEFVPEGLLGADLDWSLSENQSLVASTRIFPDLSESGEFRTFTTAGWKIDIDRADGMSFSINAIHEYISDVDPGVEKTDLQLFAGLTYDF